MNGQSSHQQTRPEPIRAGSNSSEAVLDVVEPLIKFGLIALILLSGVFTMLQSGYIPALRWHYQYSYYGESKVISTAIYMTPLGIRQHQAENSYPFVRFMPLRDEEKPLHMLQEWIANRQAEDP